MPASIEKSAPPMPAIETLDFRSSRARTHRPYVDADWCRERPRGVVGEPARQDEKAAEESKTAFLELFQLDDKGFDAMASKQYVDLVSAEDKRHGEVAAEFAGFWRLQRKKPLPEAPPRLPTSEERNLAAESGVPPAWRLQAPTLAAESWESVTCGARRTRSLHTAARLSPWLYLPPCGKGASHRHVGGARAAFPSVASGSIHATHVCVCVCEGVKV